MGAGQATPNRARRPWALYGGVAVGILATGVGVTMWALNGFGASRGNPPLRTGTSPEVRGLAISLHADDKADMYVKWVDEIGEMGCNTVLMLIPYYQDYIESTQIYGKPWHIKPATFNRLVAKAHEHKMQVIVVPIVLIRYPRTSKDWRGVIKPPSWDKWFANYKAKIGELARWCQDAKVDILAVGSELSSTERMRDRWVDVIEHVKRLYKGKLTYSSNWDRYFDIRFWDLLDYVGMTAYWEINKNKHKQPKLEELMARWREIVPDVQKWLRKQNKPLIFTEVGYASQDMCSYWPWNYYGSETPDMEEQALCYESFLKAWGRLPEVHGIIMYDWQDEGGPKNTGYTARGKTAEKVLRRWLKGELK